MKDLTFNAKASYSYRNPSQRARVLSEAWVSGAMYCPNCGNASLLSHRNNAPVADFFCRDCGEEYELKSQKNTLGKKIVDGAYTTMIARLKGKNNPNLLVLHYHDTALAVVDFLIIPKHFFTIDTIEIRKPLASSARRAGWVGCNILLERIPKSGRIFLVKDGTIQPRADVLKIWKQTLFLRDQHGAGAKGWLLSVMSCIEDIGADQFSLADVYKCEDRLKQAYPGNHHVKDKIRHQLQILRDNGYLRFTARGSYQRVRAVPG